MAAAMPKSIVRIFVFDVEQELFESLFAAVRAAASSGVDAKPSTPQLL